MAYSPRGMVGHMRLLGIHEHLRPVLPLTIQERAPAWCMSIIRETPATLGTLTGLVSDASYIRSERTLHSAFRLEEAPPTQAEGAFVLFKAGTYRPVLGVIITSMRELSQYNAFIGELFTGLALAQYRSGLPGALPAWLDCESVLTGMEQRLPSQSDFYANLHRDYGPILHQFHRLRRGTAHPPIRWTRGHADQTRVKKDGTILPAIPRREWGVSEYGIYIADHLADLTKEAESRLRSEHLYPSKIVRIPIATILKAIPTAGKWIRCLRAEPDIPIVLPQRQLADHRIFRDYCRNRDLSSIHPPRWEHICIGLLKSTLKMLKAWG